MNATTFTIYRSSIRSYYPDDGTGYRYTFGRAYGRTCHHPGTDLITQTETDGEAFAEISAPDGSHLAMSNGHEICLYLPAKGFGHTAAESYFMAREGFDGLGIVSTLQESR